MAEFRETFPTITGPGAFLVSLIFIALILTSSESRNLAFDWQFAVALVAISYPISILITQLYHALFTRFGFRKKNFGERYAKYKKNMYKVDTMVDFLFWKKGNGEKEWRIIQKRATAYNLLNMLRCISILFILAYTIFLVWNRFYEHMYIIWWGVGLTYGIVILCTISFWLACDDIWDVWMILDREIIKDIESDLDAWVKDEIEEDRGKD